MNAYYSEVPQRLCAYRKALEKTQKEMAEKFGVKQDHYSRLESGKTFLSYRNLLCFVSNGGDIYYLITGKERYVGVIDAYLDNFKLLRDKVEIVKLILWATYQSISYEKSNEIYEIKRAWKHIELIENEKKMNSIWRNIRKVEGISQQRMAERLDINIKRYQRMENLRTKPDAEILHSLFFDLGYSPLVMMKQDMFYLDEINKIWDEFPEKTRERLEGVIEQGIKLIQEFGSVSK